MKPQIEQTAQKFTIDAKQRVVNKLKISFNIIFVVLLSLLIALTTYYFVQFSSIGYLFVDGIIAVVASIILTISFIVVQLCQSKFVPKVYNYILLMLIAISGSVSVGTLIHAQFTLSRQLFYGPLSFIHEDGTRIHWAARFGSKYYHSTTYPGSNFNYTFQGKQYENVLPDQISKFVVMTDIHQNNQYTSTMSTDYDFAVFCGDYSSSGKVAEFSRAFSGMPTKPLLMAMGNHDEPGNFSQVNGREKNFFQKVRNLGFYFIHVQQGTPIVDAEVDRGIQFILDNINLGVQSDHVFIVVHHPVFSTGEFGSHQYFSQKIEQLITDHPELKIRATFSGHDHMFSAFQKGSQFFFVNGAGGGGIDQMTDSSYGVRQWPSEELHGPQSIVADNCYGYDLHLDSWMKFTRTEVNFEPGKIVYNVRDLDSDVVLKSYEQPI
ncbi:Alkaline_phosphatase [Hexamita inflata]|uniref:Alkaline_phosphatase n=1 Tax=Hexamita inflata TaxID=28002 RepID=A0ABP1HM85_9EUKA